MPPDLKKLKCRDVEELLRLWWAEQGEAKKRDLDLIASALPFASRARLRVLDLCCGPGDVGRAIRRRFPKAVVDCVDRDDFLISICAAVNRRERIPGRILLRDLNCEDWDGGLAPGYDAVATANALHWLERQRAAALFGELFRRLRPGGVLVLVEPACPEPPYARGFARWKHRQPARYSEANWKRFWSRANLVLGYDHTRNLGPRGDARIGDTMTVQGWTQLLYHAGFEAVDTLLRDADEVMLVGSRPARAPRKPRPRGRAGRRVESAGAGAARP